jgi:hypothetical protein
VAFLRNLVGKFAGSEGIVELFLQEFRAGQQRVFALAAAADVDLQHLDEHGPGGFPGILLGRGLLHDHGGFLRFRFRPVRSAPDTSGTPDHEVGTARPGGGPAGLLLGGAPRGEFL